MSKDNKVENNTNENNAFDYSKYMPKANNVSTNATDSDNTSNIHSENIIDKKTDNSKLKSSNYIPPENINELENTKHKNDENTIIAYKRGKNYNYLIGVLMIISIIIVAFFFHMSRSNRTYLNDGNEENVITCLNNNNDKIVIEFNNDGIVSMSYNDGKISTLDYTKYYFKYFIDFKKLKYSDEPNLINKYKEIVKKGEENNGSNCW